MINLQKILDDSFLRDEFIKCIKYKTLNRQYLPKYSILNEYCYQLWNIDFQYKMFMYVLKNYKTSYKDVLNILSELFFQTLISNVENLDAIAYFAKRENELKDIYKFYEDVLTKDKKDLEKYIEILKKEVWKSPPEVKGLLLRKISWLEDDDNYKISLLKEAIYFCSDPFEKRLIYYELLQILIFNGYLEDVQVYLEEAKKEFPYEDIYYEIDGHLGMFFIENEEYEKGKEYLKIVYEWLVYKSLEDPEDTDFLNGNFIVFLTVFAKSLYDDNQISEAEKVFEFIFYILKNFISKIYDNEPEATKPIFEENIYSFLVEYTNFLHNKNGEKKSKVFEYLKKEILSSKSINKNLTDIIKEFSISE